GVLACDAFAQSAAEEYAREVRGEIIPLYPKTVEPPKPLALAQAPVAEPNVVLTVNVVANDVLEFDGSKSSGGTLSWTAIPSDILFQVADGKQKALAIQTNPADQFCTVGLVVTNGAQFSVALLTVPLPVKAPTPEPPTPPAPPTPPTPPPAPVPTAANPFVMLITDNANESSLPPIQQTLVENREFWIDALPGQWRTADVSESAASSFKPWLAAKKIAAPALVFMDTSKNPPSVLGVEPLPLTGDGLAPLVFKYTTPKSKSRN